MFEPVSPTRAGVGLRLPHLNEVAAARPPVPWFEIHPENFIGNPHATFFVSDADAVDPPASFI